MIYNKIYLGTDINKSPSIPNIELKLVDTYGIGQSKNMLIKGDNLLVLKALKKEFTNKVKLIYIDPPYNTGNKDFVYSDKRNHDEYLSFMENRLEIALELLSDDGVIFLQCDDNEQAYLKVLMDNIFGRENFISCAIWHFSSVLKQSKLIRKDHEYILIYAKNKEKVIFNKLKNSMCFKNIDNDPRGAWFSSNAASPNQNSDKNRFAIKLPNGNECIRSWKFSQDDYKNNLVSLYFKGNNIPRLKIYEKDYGKNTAIQSSIFTNLGSLMSAKTELKKIFNVKDVVFSTPKPEILLKRILKISTNENDLVLDFFAGSGTTLAVAHKMKRRYIGIEEMDYIESVTKERLKKVIDGEQCGVSKAVKWQGGGSFSYYQFLSKKTLASISER